MSSPRPALELGAKQSRTARLTAADEVERQALERLVAADEVVPHGVRDQPDEIVPLRERASSSQPGMYGTGEQSNSNEPEASLHHQRTSLSSMEHAMYPTCFSAYLHQKEHGCVTADTERCAMTRCACRQHSRGARRALRMYEVVNNTTASKNSFTSCKVTRAHFCAAIRSDACLWPNSTG